MGIYERPSTIEEKHLTSKALAYNGFESHYAHIMKYKHGTKEYWMDWYWNRGGREKVQARRYIREYERYEKEKTGVLAKR